MLTFRAGDHALWVRSGQTWLAAPERVHVVAVLKDGGVRVRRYDGSLRTCRLSELEHARPLTSRGYR